MSNDLNISNHPFGLSIKAEDILDNLSFFDDWEDRYKYIIELGKELPNLDDKHKIDQNKISGCQSQVWIISKVEDEQLLLQADSDAVIVKGLLALVLAAYNNKSKQQVREFDFEGYFEDLKLVKHLSATRGNGLRAMVAYIQNLASN